MGQSFRTPPPSFPPRGRDEVSHQFQDGREEPYGRSQRIDQRNGGQSPDVTDVKEGRDQYRDRNLRKSPKGSPLLGSKNLTEWSGKLPTGTGGVVEV